MIYTTDKSRKKIHLDALLEIMAETSITCIVAMEKGEGRSSKEVTIKLLKLREKMIEAFDNLFDSKEVTSKAMKLLFRVVMRISDDIHQVTTLLNFRKSV